MATARWRPPVQPMPTIRWALPSCTYWFDCGNTRGVPPQTAYSIATSATPPVAFTNGNPAANSRWLRWTIPSVDINTTGCLCYRVTVN